MSTSVPQGHWNRDEAKGHIEQLYIGQENEGSKELPVAARLVVDVSSYVLSLSELDGVSGKPATDPQCISNDRFSFPNNSQN